MPPLFETKRNGAALIMPPPFERKRNGGNVWDHAAPESNGEKWGQRFTPPPI